MLTHHFSQVRRFFFLRPAEAIRNYGKDVLLGPNEDT